jgi:hypothetical protein
VTTYCHTELSNKEISKHVFDDCKSHRKATKTEIISIFEVLWYHRLYNIEDQLRKGIDTISILLSFSTIYTEHISKLLPLLQESMKSKNYDNKLHNQINNIISEISMLDAEDWISEHKGWWYTILEYSDDSDIGSILEHGNIFKHVEHLKASNH